MKEGNIIMKTWIGDMTSNQSSLLSTSLRVTQRQSMFLVDRNCSSICNKLLNTYKQCNIVFQVTNWLIYAGLITTS